MNFGEYEENVTVYEVSERIVIAESYFNATGIIGTIRHQPIKGYNLTYVSQQCENGSAVIIDAHGASLFAPAGTNPHAHLNAFLAGKRSNAPYFTQPKTQAPQNPSHRQSSASRSQQPANAKQSAKSNSQSGSNSINGLTAEEIEKGYTIDEKTGRKYKKMPKIPSEAVKASKKNENSGLTLDQARRYLAVDEDFDLDDLDGSAETFLSHLRVPPNKAEQEAMKEERRRKARLQQQAIDQLNEEQAREDAKLNPFIPEVKY